MISQRLAYGIGRPDRAVSARQFQVSTTQIPQSAAVVHAGAGANDAKASFDNTTNISLGFGGLMVLAIVGIYWWTRDHQG